MKSEQEIRKYRNNIRKCLKAHRAKRCPCLKCYSQENALVATEQELSWILDENPDFDRYTENAAQHAAQSR